ncbi:probable nucleoredoxin 1 [Quercus lobata]|uniref:probable nucleoredoxin 1 n=1 Tax=Quercus lobata TaxID=97700 RepID=UPI001245A950|nr:probable nucleoredoxin 1 [Quercus lobata]
MGVFGPVIKNSQPIETLVNPWGHTDEDYEFDDSFSKVPWLGLPRGDRRIYLAQLAFQIQRRDTPAVIALGPTRKAKALTLLYGAESADAYPFSDERLLKVETQTEEMTMDDWPRKVKRDLHVNYDVGKTFRTEPGFGVKRGGFVARYEDYEFDESFSKVPWLGLPRGDRRLYLAQLAFQIQRRDTPAVIALGPTRKAKALTLLYGAESADAYPFSDERLPKVETQTEEMAMDDWPRKVKRDLLVNYDVVRCSM